ncbi:uncharacterized protein E0L32_007189 [Thyridium curvatum]|uniref:Uncharacterized protein n=1 Tax=Thyridium curvatum TaxID=1093900 RepID=A0A507B036_9PEZI|nr:uncharacterized protein E0L32_007189 [Thyridium curvatum]TPX12074.1 hypothetical protein E0L32_007189 [Thyridium curvatum]
MLPSSKRYLLKGGVDEQTAGFIMMGCFVAGFIGIQIISRVLHRFMPSHVVDCDHSHEGHGGSKDAHSELNGAPRRSRRSLHKTSHSTLADGDGLEDVASESTPLLESSQGLLRGPHTRSEGGLAQEHSHSVHDAANQHSHSLLKSRRRTQPEPRRPSMMQVRDRVLSFVKDTKSNCDEFGPCFGYTDPCGQECFKHLSSRNSAIRTTTNSIPHQHLVYPSLPEDVERDSVAPLTSPKRRTSRVRSRDLSRSSSHASHGDYHCCHGHDHAHDHAGDSDDELDDDAASTKTEDLEAQHHHHVPTNAFMSIGLQTVIAIALHKFPEGFITFATNHANPSLGFNVFMALFVHNIAEGFSMALPLYMALDSRWRAMAWSSLLGGLSQPAGAGMAALWFRLARRGNLVINSVAYACLFAATAGIMTSVALQLFVESLSLNHNRNLSIGFAFLGMTLLGLSNALVTD